MIVEKLINIIKNENSIIISQTGFIETNFYICKAKLFFSQDILTLKDEQNNIYISINVNQIQNTKEEKNYIKLYMDNDTQIKIANRI